MGTVVLGAVIVGVGVVVLAWSLTVPMTDGPTEHEQPSTRSARGAGSAAVADVGARLAVVGLVGVVAGALTGWPVGGLLAAVASAGLPALWRQLRSGPVAERAEAVASWCEMLRDTLQASAGLVQAIVVTAPMAPAAIRPAVGMLADRLVSGVPADEALHALAEDIADPTADMVVCALVLATSARAQRVGDLLGALAASARDRVAAELRVHTARASTRSGVRLIAGFSCAFAVVMVLVAHAYLAPFGTATGQLVLAIVGLVDVGGLWLLGRMARPDPPARILLAPAPERRSTPTVAEVVP
jgi:Flp pilus assembly protein TadB